MLHQKKRAFINYALTKTFLRFADQPQMPPLTPGTNKKLTEVLNASFASWEKEVQLYKITKGKFFAKCNLINAQRCSPPAGQEFL
jgi:hypothetical protein